MNALKCTPVQEREWSLVEVMERVTLVTLGSIELDVGG
jgi:hypothetical protein